jgi:hypothetical protein
MARRLPTCQPQKAQGNLCSEQAGVYCNAANCRICSSGNCVDGYCCDTACNGACDACSVATGANANGTCSVVSPGAPGNPACSPYVCSGSSAACPGVCLKDADCDSTHYCASDQTCAPRKAQGLNCDDGAGGDCQVTGCRVCTTGNCVDGYCCDTACSGTCQACSAVKKGSGVNGTCGAVASKTDPDNECTAAAVAGCGENGNCDGAGACALYASGTVCQPKSCANGTTQNNADTCDGNGTCVDKGTTSCSPYSCSGTSCVGGSCNTDADCQSGYYCGTDGQCHGQKSQGQSCDPAADCKGGSCGVCATGHCVDGVCCDTACAAACDACSTAAGASTNGTCAILSAGAAGAPACTPLVCDGSNAACPTACVSDAGCDATHYCAADQTCKPKKVQGSLCDKSAGGDCFNTGCGVCQTGNCVDGFCCDTACSGACQSCSSAAKGAGNNGECGAVADRTDPDGDCSPYTCTAGACGTGCTADADCGSGKACVTATGQCVTPAAQGTQCSVKEECQSGFCVDGVCCDTACTGQCEACNAATPGTCVGIDGNPHGKRPACGSDGSNCAGTCKSQNRAQCTYPASGNACGSPTCTNGTAETFACDGQGTCAAQSTKDCSPYVCDATECKTACTSNADCTQGYGCSADGKCVPTGNSKCSKDLSEEQTPTGTKACDAFLCNPASGTCREVCSASDQCATGYVCNPTTKTCVKQGGGASGQDQGGCGCRTAGRRQGGGAPVLALLSLLLLGAYRRRDRV